MIIFLDFDGVLHPDAVYARPNKPLQLETEGELFMHSPILIDALTPYPEAKIILSTSWVKVLGYSRTLKKMPPALAKRVVGATYHKHMRLEAGYDVFSNLTRYQQINAHNKRNAISNWIAIDDLHSGDEIYSWPNSEMDHLLLIEQSMGLRCSKIQACLHEKLRAMYTKR